MLESTAGYLRAAFRPSGRSTSSEMVGSRINSSTPMSLKLAASSFSDVGVVGADSAILSAHESAA
jgi:hypothetical protein